MKSRLFLTTPMIQKIVAALPGADHGRIVVDLGNLGVVSLKSTQLSIGKDVLQLPVTFHLRGNPDTKGLPLTLSLTEWHIRDGVIWFKLDKMGRIEGALFQRVQDALFTLIRRFSSRPDQDPALFRRQTGRLGIPAAALLEAWLSPPVPFQITDIELDEGIILYLT